MDQKEYFKQFIKDRNEALFSFDKDTIMAYMKKYHVPDMPDDDRVFWGAVAKAVVNIKDAPEDYKPTLYFDMFFFIEDFPTEIADAYHLQQLVDTLTDQYQEVTA